MFPADWESTAVGRQAGAGKQQAEPAFAPEWSRPGGHTEGAGGLPDGGEHSLGEETLPHEAMEKEQGGTQGDCEYMQLHIFNSLF